MAESFDDTFRADEVAAVAFVITYIEEGHEAILDEGQTIVECDSTTAALAAQKASDFLESLSKGHRLPSNWLAGKHPDGDYGYSPSADHPETYSLIPEQRRQFLQVSCEILRRTQRDRTHEDRQQHALDAIRRTIGD